MILELNTKNKNNQILIKQAQPALHITNKDGTLSWLNELVVFIQDMKDTLTAQGNDAIALAANQVWHENLRLQELPRVFVMKVDGIPMEFINPIIKITGKSIKDYEGCLSFTKMSAKLKRRHKNTSIVFQTLTDINKPMLLKFGDLYSRAIQHELDHLNGKTLYQIKL